MVFEQRYPHPIPPHEGEGADGRRAAGHDCFCRQVALNADVTSPSVLPVGRGGGWGALAEKHG